MRVDEAIAEELGRHDVTAAFALMSDEISKLIIALADRGVAIHTTRHEAAAIGMADGYARLSGSMGVALVGRGPGLTNALTAIVCAAKSRSAVLILVGDSATGGRDPRKGVAAGRQPKHVDQAAILSACAVASVSLASPSAAIADLRLAVETVLRGRTVVVNLPSDVLAATAGDLPPTVAFPFEPIPAVDATLVATLADRLAAAGEASRPVILAGRGATAARPVLDQLGDRLGALMGDSLLAKSMFGDDPFDLGIVGGFSTPVARELLQRATIALVFGASLSPYTTLGDTVMPNAWVVQVDADATAFGRFSPVDMAIHAGVSEVAEALVAELDRRAIRRQGFRTADVAARLAAYCPDQAYVDRGVDGALDPRTVMLAIDRILPDDRTVVIDPGHHLSWAAAYLRVPEPEAFAFPGDFGAIGSAPAIAYGAALARPDRITVLAVGDGGMMMSLADLETAVRYRAHLVIIVTNDSAFGSEVQFLRAEGRPDTLARYATVEFEAVARAMGADAVTIRTLADLERLPAAIRTMDGPLVIDCRVTTEVRAEWVDFRLRRDSTPPEETA